MAIIKAIMIFTAKPMATICVKTSRDDHIVAWLTALAITIHILESALPSPFPGIKPGLANVVTILVLCRYGVKMAAWVSLLRVLVASLLLGTFMSPTFLLSLSGTIGALIALVLAVNISRVNAVWVLGPVGYSIVGALAHITAQFYVAYALFIQHDALFSLLPVLATTSLIFGIISGLIIYTVLPKLEGVDVTR